MNDPGLRARRLDLVQLKHEFDQSFASAVRTRELSFEELLVLRVGSAVYAVRARETNGLVATAGATGVPSPMPELEGLVGLRGALVPLFRLSTLLGSSDAAEASRWVLLIGRDEPIGLGFHAPDAYHKLPSAALVPAGDVQGAGPFVRELANVDARRLAVLDVPRLVLELQQRILRQRSRKEG